MLLKKKRGRNVQDNAVIKRSKSIEVEGKEDIIDVVNVDENLTKPSKSLVTKEKLRLWDCIQTVKPSYIYTNQRKYYEKSFRSYLLKELDIKLTDMEKEALNQANIKDIADKYEVLPSEECFACEKLSQKPQKYDASERRVNKSKLIYPTNDNSTSFKMIIPIRNPLFKNYIARYPDMRVTASNIDKLQSVFYPKTRRVKSRDPVAVHVCQKKYGEFLHSATKVSQPVDHLYIRSLCFYESIPSSSAFNVSSNIIDTKMKKWNHIKFFPCKTRSSSEPPSYSKVSTFSPYGVIKPRVSRSLSPVKKRRRKIRNNKPEEEIFEVPHDGELLESPLYKHENHNEIFCTMLNGKYVTAFYSVGAETGVLMVKKSDGCLSKIRFRRFNIECNGLVFPCFTFTMVEQTPLEYLIHLRYSNFQPINLMMPSTKIGALMPRRQIFDYLRIVRRIPKPITWVKKSNKRGNFRAVSLNRKNDASFKIVDIFKYLGLYCIIPKESMACYAALGMYKEMVHKINKDIWSLVHRKSFNVADLLSRIPVSVYEDDSTYWKEMCSRIESVIKGMKIPTRDECVILNMNFIIVPGTIGEGIIPLMKVIPGLNRNDIRSVNEYLVDYYFQLQRMKYSMFKDAYETDYESGSDVECDVQSTVKRINKPRKIPDEKYCLNDHSKIVMHDPHGNDISNIVPISRYLTDKMDEKNVLYRKKRNDVLYEKREKRKWDESDEDDFDVRSRSRKSKNSTPSLTEETPSVLSEFGDTPVIDFDTISVCTNSTTTITDESISGTKKVIFIGNDMVRYYDPDETEEACLLMDTEESSNNNKNESDEEEEEDDWEIRKKKKEAEALAALQAEEGMDNANGTLNGPGSSKFGFNMPFSSTL